MTNVSAEHDDTGAASESAAPLPVPAENETELVDLVAPTGHFHRTKIRRGLQAGPTANPLRTRLI